MSSYRASFVARGAHTLRSISRAQDHAAAGRRTNYARLEVHFYPKKKQLRRTTDSATKMFFSKDGIQQCGRKFNHCIVVLFMVKRSLYLNPYHQPGMYVCPFVLATCMYPPSQPRREVHTVFEAVWHHQMQIIIGLSVVRCGTTPPIAFIFGALSSHADRDLEAGVISTTSILAICRMGLLLIVLLIHDSSHRHLS